jgi:hypothetical protein
MSCKVNRNGIVCVNTESHSEEMICLECDGCGIVNNRICRCCNGHGNLGYDASKNRTMKYSATKEQLAAMETLGGIS